MSKLKRGDVFFCDFGNKCRPWLVVQNDRGNQYSKRTIVVPLTSNVKKSLPTHYAFQFGKIKLSTVECEGIRNVYVDPEWRVVEHLPPYIMRQVDKALKIAIGVG